MKTERQRKILETIKAHSIETQEELTSKLIEAGYRVTQATVSRDIKELRIIKVSDDNGRYKYATADTDRVKVRAKYQSIIDQTVTHADHANNLVVIKTFAGMAQAAGAAIDAFTFDGVLGCIAGDDTILVVAKDTECARIICTNITDIISHR